MADSEFEDDRVGADSIPDTGVTDDGIDEAPGGTEPCGVTAELMSLTTSDARRLGGPLNVDPGFPARSTVNDPVSFSDPDRTPPVDLLLPQIEPTILNPSIASFRTCLNSSCSIPGETRYPSSDDFEFCAVGALFSPPDPNLARMPGRRDRSVRYVSRIYETKRNPGMKHMAGNDISCQLGK